MNVLFGFILLIQLTWVINAQYHWYPLEGGNNPKHFHWGSAGDSIIREHPHLPYDNEYWEPSARVISNIVASSKHGWTNPSPRNISSFLTVWGQFIDHDMVYTKRGDEYWPIHVPKGDPVFDPHGEGHKEIPFYRTWGEKEKININTAWIDASMIYGSTYEVSFALRSFEDGELRVSHKIPKEAGEFPPFVHEIPEELRWAVPTDNNVHKYPTDHLFALGDPRANENPLILSLHVLFWRDHNRVARILHHKHPEWHDDQLFETARKYVIATIQKITYDEYMYWLLARPFPEKDYYDPHVDPRVHIFFSTVAFRYGHSEIGDLIQKSVDGHFGKFPQWQFSHYKEWFYDPYFILEHAKLNNVFEGLACQVQQSVDAQIADVVRNHLFQEPHGPPKYDLFSIDIQRGRDHKIPSYNHARQAYGLKPFHSWEDFDALDERLNQDEKELKSDLAKVYRNPWEADSIVAGLAADWVRTPYTEKHHDYSNLGDLFEAAIISQFQRTRVGDRFFYSRNLDEVNCHGDLKPVEHRKLSDVIRDNVHDVHLPDDVFKVWYNYH